MKTLQISPPRLSDVATLLLEIQKSHFSILLFIYFRLFTLPQKKTLATIVLQLYLFTYYCLVLPSPSTASGARYKRQACTDMDMLMLAAAAYCDMR